MSFLFCFISLIPTMMLSTNHILYNIRSTKLSLWHFIDNAFLNSQQSLETRFIVSLYFFFTIYFNKSFIRCTNGDHHWKKWKVNKFCYVIYSLWTKYQHFFLHFVISTCSYSHGSFLGGLLRWISSEYLVNENCF